MPLRAFSTIASPSRRYFWKSDRSRSDLRGLSDSVLKDIGLYREDLGRSRIQPHWYTD